MFPWLLKHIASVVLLLAGSRCYAADETWQPLFNGKDLSGWVIVNVAPSTFTARDGMIVSTGVPTGTLRTERMYENFIMEVEWRHMQEKGNAGVFIWGDPITHVGQPFSRGIEVQVLDGRNSDVYTSHGDVFSIWGAKMTPDRPHPKGSERCLPSEQRCKPSPEWNHYRITCNNGVIKLAVNGKEVSGGSACRPRKGYICLESEGSECHFRNLKIQELPSTNPAPDEIAQEYRGFVPMYTGIDLAGWRQTEGHAGHWRPKDWILQYDGKSEAKEPKEKHLWTAKEYGDFQMIVDWRLLKENAKRKSYPVVLPSGDDKLDEKGQPVMQEVDDAGNTGILLRGNEDAQINICCYPVGSGEVTAFRTNKQLPAEVRAALTPKQRADAPLNSWNRFEITLQGDRLTVVLNGKEIITKAQLPGLAARGPIGLQHHNEVVEFANLFIREI